MKPVYKHFGQRPWWKTIIAAVLCTLGFMCLYHAFVTPPHPNQENNPGNILTWLFFAFWCLAFFWILVKVTDFEIDLEQRKYRVTNTFFIFVRTGWKQFINVDKITLTKKGNIFFVHIIYNRKRDVMITKFSRADEAHAFAKEASVKLETKLTNYIELDN